MPLSANSGRRENRKALPRRPLSLHHRVESFPRAPGSGDNCSLRLNYSDVNFDEQHKIYRFVLIPEQVAKEIVILPDRGEFRIGPPQQLPLPAEAKGMDTDRSGRIVAVTAIGFAFVATPDAHVPRGPAVRLPACRP